MKGIIGIIALLIALGLVLRFGKTSHALAGDVSTTALGLVDKLTLSGFQGNPL